MALPFYQRALALGAIGLTAYNIAHDLENPGMPVTDEDPEKQKPPVSLLLTTTVTASAALASGILLFYPEISRYSRYIKSTKYD